MAEFRKSSGILPSRFWVVHKATVSRPQGNLSGVLRNRFLPLGGTGGGIKGPFCIQLCRMSMQSCPTRSRPENPVALKIFCHFAVPMMLPLPNKAANPSSCPYVHRVVLACNSSHAPIPSPNYQEAARPPQVIRLPSHTDAIQKRPPCPTKRPKQATKRSNTRFAECFAPHPTRAPRYTRAKKCRPN